MHQGKKKADYIGELTTYATLGFTNLLDVTDNLPLTR